MWKTTGGGQNYRETFITPMALDGERTKLPNSALSRHWIKKGGGTNLAEQIAFREMFPTPTVQDSKNVGYNGSHQFNLHKYIALFPTPTVTGNNNRKGSGKKSGNGLATIARMYPTPQATSWGCTGAREKLKKLQADGEITDHERRAMSAGNGGKLNPTWVEWLMGFPIGWTDCDASETQ